MKTLFLLLELVCIPVTCVVSGSLYLEGEYNMSALLTLTWVIFAYRLDQIEWIFGG